MEENTVDSMKTNETHQPSNNEWRNEPNTSNNTLSNNDNYEQHIVDTFNNSSINDNSVFDNSTSKKQENNNGYNNCTQEDGWNDPNTPKNQYNNKNNSEYRRGRGGFNKSNNSWGYNSSSYSSNNSGRGRGTARRYNENESFESGYNSNYNNQDGGYHTPDHRGRGRGRGRGQNRGRGGGRFRNNSNNDLNENNEDGQRKYENDKSNGPKPVVYRPPDIENEESIIGIEAGQHFDDYAKIEVQVSGNDPPKSIKSFPTSGLRNILLDNLSTCNFSTPTPIQNYSIPIVMGGRDLMASAQTGSGKTAAYILPILHNLLSEPIQLIFDKNHCEPQVIIMAPTRELTIQIRDCVHKFGRGAYIRYGLLYGGTSVDFQKSKILEKGIHVLVATPGRLIDFVDKGIVTLSSVKFFVLDEADRMLDMGFRPIIEQVLKHATMTSKDVRQTLMFSATFPSEIQHMAKSYLKPDYLFVAVGDIGGACKDVEQTIKEVKKFDKKKTLLDLLKNMEDSQGTIVFVEQKRVADFTATYLSEMDFPTTSIHGDREQAEREQALRDFKINKMKILVATAVAARGLDIKDVKLVINYDLPKNTDEYVHRIGRTGRLGNVGKAISFYDPECDGPMASELIRILKQAEQEIPPWLIEAAENVKANPTADNFNDIRTNVDTTSEMVEVEEEW